jgi:hypothetical protein
VWRVTYNRAASVKLSVLRALASGGDGSTLRASVPRFSLTDPVEEDPIKVAIVGGTGTISSAIVARLLALQSQAGATCYDIVCINRGITSASPYPKGVRHLLLDRHERDSFEKYVHPSELRNASSLLCIGSNV